MVYKSFRSDTNPCYKCADRSEVCHGECEKYIKWNEGHLAEVEAMRRAKIAEKEVSAVRRASYDKGRKRFKLPKG